MLLTLHRLIQNLRSQRFSLFWISTLSGLFEKSIPLRLQGFRSFRQDPEDAGESPFIVNDPFDAADLNTICKSIFDGAVRFFPETPFILRM